ncbi:amino acid adenylation domain-containing protein [Ketobacter sp. MCCC 1A13808]|uniref:non-ribosomal peptide synthetase n=1 Tax=Ketobacter sp. MCCC 1A13808 TaxID=2602738 RepID=UPI0012EB9E0F|nr:non-ribosomal peptide synthetase [Ketobacter sp. MCCC 1A13808]MVF12546.1 amino acid adenylation domain-containing protein [Ketobacter sp. MCCC 1A13808]
MNVVEFLASLSKLDIRLWLEGENLRFSAPEGAFTPEIKARVVGNKSEIIEFLRQAKRLTEAPIEAVSRDLPLVTSFGQQRLWLLDQLNPHDVTYNMSSALRIKGPLNAPVLEKVFATIVKRQESLRTYFKEVDGEPVQCIHPVDRWALHKIDLSDHDAITQQSRVAEEVNKESLTPYDLSVGPLFRARLLVLAEDHHVLIAGMHHIISDGWSMEVLVKELSTLYMVFAAGMPSPLAPLAIQYADYSAWQRQQMSAEEMQKQLDYWQQTLRDAPVVLPLPTDRPRQDIPTNNGAICSADFANDLCKKINSTCSDLGVTPFMFLLGAWQLLLGRYANSVDVVVGSPIAGRSRSEVQELIGFFVNMLLMRIDLSGNPTVKQFYSQVKEMTLGAFSHQDLPIDKLMDAMDIERQPGFPPLAQVAFQLINLQEAKDHSPFGETPVEIEALPTEHVSARMDMLLGIAKSGDCYKASLEYNTDLFDAATVAAMLEQYQFLVQELCADADRNIGDIAIYDATHLLQQLGCDPAQNRLIELTPNQKVMFLDQQANPDTTQNVFGVYVDLPQQPDTTLLTKAVNWIVGHAPVLRMQLVVCDLPAAEPVYGVIPDTKTITLELVEAQDDVLVENPLHQTSMQLMHRADDGLAGDLVEFSVVHYRNRYRFVVSCHHLLLDGSSAFMLVERILNAYRNLLAGEPPQAFVDEGAFAFEQWSRTQMDSPAVLEYWKQQGQTVEPLNFPLASRDHQTPETVSAFGDVTQVAEVDRRHLDTIREFCAANQINVPLYFKLLYGLMLKQVCRAETAFSFYEFYGCRKQPWLDSFGCFYQQFPCVVDGKLLAGPASLRDWIDNLILQRNQARQFRTISLQKQYELVPSGRTIFMFNYYDFVSQMELNGSTLQPQLSTPKVDRAVQFIVKEGVDNLQLELRYAHNAFQDVSFLPRLMHLSEQILFDEIAEVTQLNYLSAAEQLQLSRFETEQLIDPAWNVLSGFEASVQRFATNIALVDSVNNENLSYSRLNQKANRLAHYLIETGVTPGSRVAICLGRTADLLVSILAVMKAGAAYVPLDPDYPRERLAFIVSDCAASMLIGERQTLDLIGGHNTSSIVLTEIGSELQQYSDQNPGLALSPEQPIYAIYTSGSTGQPKGALVSHSGEANLQRWYLDELRISERDRTLLISAVGFDLTQKNVFAPLLAGGTLVMPGQQDYDEQALVELIRQHQITWVNCAPSAFYPLVETAAASGYGALASLRFVVLGGEPIRLNALASWLASPHCQARLMNSYGPTECTDVVAFHTLDRIESADQTIPIGKPIPNTQLHILTAQLQPQVPGCVGEICVTGAGVGLGYINRDELTQQVFIERDAGEGRLYRTGDLGRLLPDGNIEYIGRKDFQIKLNGLRIELGEVETALRALPGVEDGLVVVSQNRLVAYVVAGQEPDQWRETLRQHLPEYMIPSLVMTVQQWPLTPNGKLDRSALPDPSRQLQVASVYVAPRNDTETQISQIWQQVLQQTNISVIDDFFAIGGNSLLATRITSRIKKQFEIALSVRELFLAPSIAELSVAVNRAKQTKNIPPITLVDYSKPQPLSYAQQRLWFLDQLDPGSTAYNMPGAFRLEGDLQLDALIRSLQEIVRRHGVLRTRFIAVDDEPAQIIETAENWQPKLVDLSQLTEAQQQVAARQTVDALYSHVFNLETGPLFNIEILKFSDQQHLLTVNMHHIISDGWSNGILMGELGVLYDAFNHGRLSPLPTLNIQYVDFAAWQRHWLNGDELERQLSYWRNSLAGVEVLNLPVNKPRTKKTGFAGHVLSFTMDEKLSNGLKQLSREQGTTLYMTTLAAYQLLLSKYSNQDDICVGSPIANRNHDDIEPVIGFFVNTLALRTQLDSNGSFANLMQQVRQQTLDAYAHQDVPFERLVDELVTERDMLHSPLFQVLFSLQNIQMNNDLRVPGLKLKPIANDNVVAKFDLEFSLGEQNGVIAGEVVYRTALFNRAFVEQLISHYLRILQLVVADPSQSLNQISLVTDTEIQQLQSRNSTQSDYRQTATVHQLFEEQVDRTPDAPAVLLGTQSLSYQQLEHRANQIARYLIGQGIGTGDVVGIMLPRCNLHLMSTLLGVLKAGATYLPLDPSYPADRIAYMLEDSGTKLVVASSEYESILTASSVHYLDKLDAALDPLSSERLALQGDAKSLLYVIYTSGSTGQPKGTGANHAAEVNLLAWYCRDFYMSPADRVLLVSAIGFDLTQKNLFAPLVSGAALVLPTVHEYDPQDLVQAITQQNVTWVNCAPNAFYPIVEEVDDLIELDSLRYVFLGGEPIDIDRLSNWIQRDAGKLVNSYGPTECADIATFHVVDNADCVPGANIPIGKPIDNVKLYILDSNQKMVPQGVPGELCIGGDSVGPGYFNDPEQTRDKFIVNPYGAEHERIYRTGDLARYLTDGSVEYLGRIDSQVKIRGFRIEPGEIEAKIRQFPQVAACCVIAREDSPGIKSLAAYLVISSDEQPSTSELTHFLRKDLPEFMVPGHFVFMDQLPLTPNGKVAKNQLPAPQQSVSDKRDIALAETNTEKTILAIWQAVLSIDSLSVEDDFFSVGGHSLLATQVISRIRKQFQVNIPLRALFESPTIRTSARLVDAALMNSEREQKPPIVKVDRTKPLPLSFVQQQLWLLDQLDPGSPAYNMPVALRINGAIDTQAFKRCFDTIVQRHETLRTSFTTVQGEPVAVIHPHREWAFSEIDLSDVDALTAQRELEKITAQQTEGGFNLAQDPLIRGALVRLPTTKQGQEQRIFAGAIHHIVSDGWSLNIMIAELIELYHADVENRPARLLPLDIQYVDIAAWQRSWLQGEVLQAHLDYWRKQLDNDGRVLQIATDFPRPKVMTTRGASAQAHVQPRLIQQAKALAKEESTTLYTVLMAVYKVLIQRYTGQQHINVGSPIAGREELESENLVGFFINTVVVSSEIYPAHNGRQILRLVREQVLGAYAHQALPFEKIVEELKPPRDPSRTPFAQAFLNLLNLPVQQESNSLLNIEPLLREQDHIHAKYDFNLYVSETEDDGLALHMVYNADLYKAETVARFMQDYVRLFGHFVADTDTTVAGYSLQSQQDQNWLPDLKQPIPTQHFSGPVEQFLQHACEMPDEIAIDFQGEAISYGQLETESRAIARGLQLAGVGIEQPVAILAQRTPSLVSAILGVLRAGAAFVVLDSAYPVQRLSAITNAAAPKALINLLDSEALMQAVCAEVPMLATFGFRQLVQSGSNEATSKSADWQEQHNQFNTAYLAFTSGTTGLPKGIKGDFAAIAHFVNWYVKRFDVQSTDRFTLLSGLAHDPLLRDIFVPLSVGASICIPDGDWMANPETLLSWMETARVTSLHLTPSMADVMAGVRKDDQTLPQLRFAGFGGDRLSWKAVARFKDLAPKATVANFYGATETPQVMGYYPVIAPDLSEDALAAMPEYVPVGCGIDDVQLLILNADRQLCTPGEVGEIGIRTPYLCQGYLDGDTERFVTHAFASSPEQPDRIYLTGDKGRYRSDGQVEFLGRIDDQIKIRGFRIEPAEIERHLASLDAVDKAIVIRGQDLRGDDCLVAYLQTSSPQSDGKQSGLSDLARTELRRSLPEYMIPSLFIPLDKLPLTPNGKINKRALPAPADYWQAREYIAPRTDVEREIAEIWQTVLKMDQISVVDNFFDIGGHSLLAVQIVTRVKTAYSVEFSMRRLLEVASIEGMATYVENALWLRESEQTASSGDDEDFEELEI